MGSDGWIKLFRQMQSHPLWTDHKFSPGQAWVDLLLFASHKTHNVPLSDKVINVERGQVLTSQVKLARRWKWDRKTVARFLRGLEGAQMCRILRTIRGDIGYTLISINNFETYQRRNGTRAHSTPHSKGQSVPNQSPISPHNQEGKECKEGKEEKKAAPYTGLIFNPKADDGLGDFEGSDRERMSQMLRKRYLEEFGESWLYSQYRGICEWCIDNPRKITLKKNHYMFVMSCFRGGAERERKRRE